MASGEPDAVTYALGIRRRAKAPQDNAMGYVIVRVAAAVMVCLAAGVLASALAARAVAWSSGLYTCAIFNNKAGARRDERYYHDLPLSKEQAL